MSDLTPIQPEELTGEQQEQWRSTMSLMGWICPGFRHIWFKLLDNNNGKYVAVFSKDVPIAATDGKNVIVNPDTYLPMTVKERVFVAAHEVVHNVYGDVEFLHRCVEAGHKVPLHTGGTLPLDVDLMQKAMDYRINALLKESNIGKMPSKGLYDPKVAMANDSVIDVYQKLYKAKKGQGAGPGTGGTGQGGFDILLKPGASTGQSPQQAAAQRNPQQWGVQVAMAKALELDRKAGTMAAALKHMFDKELEPEVPWTEHIRGTMARKLGHETYSWRKPDRRHIINDLYMPSRSGFGAGWLVVWGDTSGSIGPSELDSYLGELGGIIEDVKPKRLTVIWCDAKIHRIDELEDAADLREVRTKGVGGRGGTDITPVMDWIADHTDKPDMFIAFTDGELRRYPKEPIYPVIWASVQDYKYPWGEVVRIHHRAVPAAP